MNANLGGWPGACPPERNGTLAAMQSRWVRCAEVPARSEAGALHLRTADGEVVTLQPPGDRLWALLAQPHTIDELVDVFTDPEDRDDPVARRAVAGAVEVLLRRLHRHRLIVAA